MIRSNIKVIKVKFNGDLLVVKVNVYRIAKHFILADKN